jgi:hypothetical protein
MTKEDLFGVFIIVAVGFGSVLAGMNIGSKSVEADFIADCDKTGRFRAGDKVYRCFQYPVGSAL